MKLSLRLVSVFLLSFMLLLASGKGPVEARTCESVSGKFSGVCLNSANCAKICPTEGFSSGRCSSLRCYCSKSC
ncbi:hypothetical protein AALP_AA5G011900 [Arabis alpina]|uniref:Knottins-like domain-containing protein n=1 Tax=Arabis alpina TaxID=50452 RepID=A0A087GU76_ARAAL|nr:hypothetical protein AALP_AA5G011900 [Arabis alpina]